MRRLLVILALVGLLFSPVAAVAAQRACTDSGMPMAGMAMASADDAHASADRDPCCDHAPKTPDAKACAQACAVMCGVVGALPTVVVYVAPQASVSVQVDAVLPWKPHLPSRTERPPRFIA